MSVFRHALCVLETADPSGKKQAAHDLATAWKAYEEVGVPCAKIPDTPARPAHPKLVAPSDVPRRRLGSDAGRGALLHAVAHIEFNAIDLAADMICRFASSELIPSGREKEFITDWVKVLDDEARHFGLISQRLRDFNQNYGDYPAHNGLWEAAQATRHDISARLAIAPLVLEARGLDVTPAMIDKFRRANDEKSANILQVIYEDEITHVATGAKWFHIIAAVRQRAPEAYFAALVKTHFKGLLKPPFNEEARAKAGLPRSYYASLG